MKELTIFDYLNDIYLKGKLKYNKKICSSYLLSMWLSHDKQLIDITNEINEFQFFLSDELIYKYYYYKVPQGKRFIRWVKKDEVDKKEGERINKIRNEMGISKFEMSKFKSFTSLLKSNKVDKKNEKNASTLFL